jgi:molybdate transport system ATP-binding protein
MSAELLSLKFSVQLGAFELAVDEDIPLEGVTAIFGVSGSGKSTLLRTIAGFEQPRSGHIRCGNEVWFDGDAGVSMPAHRRAAGYMFQDSRLFSHLDVMGNLQFAEKRRGTSDNLSLDHVIEVFDLESLLARRADALSGGERQRVALARTLLSAPRMLLLDEPLAALDQARKAEILPYLETLPQEFDLPTLYVSHNIDEVAHLSDRMVVMGDGRIHAQGTTAAMLERLDLEPYTGRFEAGVLVEGEVAGHDARLHLTRIDLHGGTLTVPMVAATPVGDRLRLRIRARDVAVATHHPQGLSIRNILAGRLQSIAIDAESGSAEVIIEVGDARIRSRLTLAAVEDLGLAEGDSVYALIKSVSLDPLA